MTPTTTGAFLRDRYQLVARLAVGGMGEVWQANDVLLGRHVAIKVLKAELTDDPQFLERFRREARHTAKLTHPGIAQLYDYAEEQGRAYLVMELVPGEPLSAVLARESSLDVARTLDIIAQTAAALQAAHDVGVVHRDVKPGNVLVTPHGGVKITDFGISRAADGTSLTQTGRVMGTAQYLSPEQAAGQSATPASDLYALGIVTYECLAGRRPFLGKNHVRLAEAHLREQPPPLPDHVPPQVRAFVESLLAKDPTDRPPNAIRVNMRASALRSTLLGHPAAPPVQHGIPAPAEAVDAGQLPRGPGRSDGVAAGAGRAAAPAPGASPGAAPDAAAPVRPRDPQTGPSPAQPAQPGRAAHRRARQRTATRSAERGAGRLHPAVVVAGLVALFLVVGSVWYAAQASAEVEPDADPGRMPCPRPPVADRNLPDREAAAGVTAALRSGLPGTVSSVSPCTAQAGRSDTVMVGGGTPDGHGPAQARGRARTDG